MTTFDARSLVEDASLIVGNRRTLASVLHVSYSTVSHWATGHSSPSLDMMAEMAVLAGLDLNRYVQR